MGLCLAELGLAWPKKSVLKQLSCNISPHNIAIAQNPTPRPLPCLQRLGLHDLESPFAYTRLFTISCMNFIRLCPDRILKLQRRKRKLLNAFKRNFQPLEAYVNVVSNLHVRWHLIMVTAYCANEI